MLFAIVCEEAKSVLAFIMATALPMDDSEPDRKPTKHNPLEQFMLLAKTTKGAACADLIRDMLEAPGVYVFGEILDMPNIKEVGMT